MPKFKMPKFKMPKYKGGKIHIQNAQIHRSMKGQTVENKLEQHFLGDNAGFKMIQRTHDSSATQIVLVGAFITPTCYQRWNAFLKKKQWAKLIWTDYLLILSCNESQPPSHNKMSLDVSSHFWIKPITSYYY